MSSSSNISTTQLNLSLNLDNKTNIENMQTLINDLKELIFLLNSKIDSISETTSNTIDQVSTNIEQNEVNIQQISNTIEQNEVNIQQNSDKIQEVYEDVDELILDTDNINDNIGVVGYI